MASIPRYAILSHTWGQPDEGEGEVTFEDMANEFWKTNPKKRYGANKIKMTCKLAEDEFKLSYAWVDTCCIDKSSSAELTEAINSMFKWYQKAAVCIAYLADWANDDTSFSHCRWFTRGWTLQELIAPSEVLFFDMGWNFRGGKREIREALHTVTKIDEDVLTGKASVYDIPVAVRMSWAAFRQTKREEDIAYCLLGIFDTHMPMLYGEGQKAFLRLQEQIIQDHADMSIFAWKALPENREYYSGIFASSPREFADAFEMPRIPQIDLSSESEFFVSNRGVQFTAPILESERNDVEEFVLPVFRTNRAISHDGNEDYAGFGVTLCCIGRQTYVRVHANSFQFVTFDLRNVRSTKFRVLKTLSSAHIGALETRTLHVKTTKAFQDSDIHIFTSRQIEEQYTAFSRRIFADKPEYVEASLRLKSKSAASASSLVVLFQYRSLSYKTFFHGYWKFRIFRAEDYDNQNRHALLTFPITDSAFEVAMESSGKYLVQRESFELSTIDDQLYPGILLIELEKSCAEEREGSFAVTLNVRTDIF